ncbi:MAG: hypothetical protein RSB14_06995 [Kiritimatiellia bacterium]
MSTLAPLLKMAWTTFRLNPLSEILYTFFFLLAAATGLLLGPAAIAYFWHLTPKTSSSGVAQILMLSQRYQGSRRTASMFWLGIILLGISLLPLFHHPFVGIPLWLFISQPLGFALIVADRYDLGFTVACKSTFWFLYEAPAKGFLCLGLGLLAFSGSLLFGVGILITFPIALRTLLAYLTTCSAELSIAIQKGYR